MARIHFTHKATAGLATSQMLLANEALMAGRASDALSLYTEILYVTRPGHVCALLNRSLAYIALGYPELAAADAYRAADICQKTRRMYDLVRTTCPPMEAERNGYPKKGSFRKPSKKKQGEKDGDDEYGDDNGKESDQVSGVGFLARSRPAGDYLGAESEINAQREPRYHGVESIGFRLRPPRSTSERPLELLAKAAEEYLRSERSRAKDGARWTMGTWCYPGRDWLKVETASVMLSEDGAGSCHRPPFHMLEAKAMYRLCGALWECGNGAISDALGLISDLFALDRGSVRWILTGDEQTWFDEMGNGMLEDVRKLRQKDIQRTDGLMKMKATMVNRVVYPWNYHHPDLELPEVQEELEKYCDRGSKNCSLKYCKETPGTPFALHLSAAKDLRPRSLIFEEGASMAARTKDLPGLHSCDTCGVGVYEPGLFSYETTISKHSDATKSMGELSDDWEDARTEPFSPPSLAIVSQYIRDANDEDAKQGLEKDTISLPIPEDAGPQLPPPCFTSDERLPPIGPPPPSPRPAFAELPQQKNGKSQANDSASQMPSPRCSPLFPSKKKSNMSNGHQKGHGNLASETNQDSSTIPGMDLTWCATCNDALFCSQRCADVGFGIHLPLCTTSISEPLDRQLGVAERCYTDDSVRSLDPKEIVHPKAAYLYQHLLARTVALSITGNQHPLDIDEIKWLNGELYAAPSIPLSRAFSATDGKFRSDKTASCSIAPSKVCPPALPRTRIKRLPWSFNANIVQPLHILSTLNVKHWEHLDYYDGWVINTLIAKIMHSSRISKGFRLLKRYDGDGNLTRSWKAQELKSEDVWIATLHPLLSMADTVESGSDNTNCEKALEPNLEVLEGDMVCCFSMGHDKPLVTPEPCTKPSISATLPDIATRMADDFVASPAGQKPQPAANGSYTAVDQGCTPPRNPFRIFVGERLVRTADPTISSFEPVINNRKDSPVSFRQLLASPAPRTNLRKDSSLSQPSSSHSVSSWLGHMEIQAQQQEQNGGCGIGEGEKGFGGESESVQADKEMLEPGYEADDETRLDCRDIEAEADDDDDDTSMIEAHNFHYPDETELPYSGNSGGGEREQHPYD